MEKKLSPEKIEALAVEIRSFLLQYKLWQDVTIYFNGKAFSTGDGNGYCFYNDPDHLIVLKDQDPKRCFEYVGDILSMSFEGPFYECLNDCGYPSFDNMIQDKFQKILDKYGVYYELGDAWNLTLFPDF